MKKKKLPKKEKLKILLALRLSRASALRYLSDLNDRIEYFETELNLSDNEGVNFER